MVRGIIHLKEFCLVGAVLCWVSVALGFTTLRQPQHRQVLCVDNRVCGEKRLNSLCRAAQRCPTVGQTKRVGMSQLRASIDGQSGDASESKDLFRTNGGSIDLLYDGECPICMMEVEFLKKRDIKRRIRFTNLQDPTYNPAEHGNVTFEDGMRKLRAVMPDGRVVKGVEVFRQTYKAIGLGWIFELTNLPVIGNVADNLYDVWAENRLRLTGKGDLADILVARAKELREKEPIDEDCEEECGLDFEELDD